MKAKDLMVRDVKTCTTSEDANRAAQLMWENDCGVVVVLDSESRVAGMLTDRDVCMAAYTQGLPLSSVRVVDVMSREVKSCGPEDDVSTLASVMRLGQVRRLPVIDALGTLVGIVSLNDLARRAVADRGKTVRGVGLELVAETLAELCRPWCTQERSVLPAPPPALPREATPRVPQLTS